jgi:hypothetical protein
MGSGILRMNLADLRKIRQRRHDCRPGHRI